MESYRAQPPQSFVSAAPLCKLAFYSVHDGLKRGEVFIVQTEFAHQLPNPLDRIEVGAVRREVIQHEVRSLLLPPGSVQIGVVILSIVNNQSHGPPRPATALAQQVQETPGGLSIESVRLAREYKLAVPQSHRTEVAHTLASRMVQQHRVFNLRRNPHP